MEITRCIHQIWIQGAAALPPRYRSAVSTWKTRNPGWTHHLWDDASLRGLMRARASDWWAVYSMQPEAEAKADVARYALLHTIGGLYADVDTECRRPLDRLLAPGDARLHATFYSGDTRPPVDCATNSVLAGRPGHPIWPLVLRRLETNGLHLDVVFRTGPDMLRPILRMYAEENPGDVRLIGYPHAITTAFMPRLRMRAISRMRGQNCILDFNDSARRAAAAHAAGYSIHARWVRNLRRLIRKGRSPAR
jgi:mannosyltransferase OCH1-like enzyme